MCPLSAGVFIGFLVTDCNHSSLILFLHPPPIPLKKKLCEVYLLLKASTTVSKHRHGNEHTKK